MAPLPNFGKTENWYSNGELGFEEIKEVEKSYQKTELLYDGIYYDITGWMKKHPGGKIIEMFASTEEDALHAVQQFHFRSEEKVLSIMNSLPQRKPTEKELAILSKDSEKKNSLTKDFLQLFSELKSEGYFVPSPWHIASRFFDLFVLFTVGHWIYFSSTNSLILLLGMLIVGIGYGRATLLAHECGHHSLTGNSHRDRSMLGWIVGYILFSHNSLAEKQSGRIDVKNLIKIVVLGFALGLSGSYWISQHSRHHAMPAHIKHDVDMQTLPLMAFNQKIVKNPKDGKTFFIRNQKWLFFVDTLIVTVFWKLYLHPRYALFKKKYSELAAMLIHTIFFAWVYGFTNMFFVLWIASLILLGNFALNHTHLPVTEDPKHWVEQTLAHTANIRSSYFGWTDYWTGNLNYQIEHHLFPTMPQYKNKMIRDRVKALAKKHNLPYILMNYGEACVRALDNLGHVASELN